MLPNKSSLQQKYATNSGFRQQMLEAQSKYKQLLQRSLYSDLSEINPKAIIQAGMDDQHNGLFFVFGRQQPKHKKSIDKLYMYIIKYMDERIDKKQFQPYSIVYFSTCCGYGNYSTFKSIFRTMPMKYLVNLKRIIIVDPSFTVKALEWFVTGTVNNLLYSSSVYVKNFKELKGQKISMSNHKLSLLPSYIKENKNDQISRLSIRESIQSRIIKKSPEKISKTKKLKIQDYEVNEIGVPIGLYLMISYFLMRKQTLKEEGLFRKSVVKQDVDEAMEFVKVKYYDFLEEVTNPHIVANMITRFIGDFEDPLIPYSVYQKFVHDEGKSNQIHYVKEVFDVLPMRNHVTLLYLFDFLLEEVVPLKDWNKMTTYNLAVVLSPCLLRSGKEVAIEQLMYSKKLVLIMEFVLNNYNEIFGSKEERLGVFRKSLKIEAKRFMEENIEGVHNQDDKKKESAESEDQVGDIYFDMDVIETDSLYGDEAKEHEEKLIEIAHQKTQDKNQQPKEEKSNMQENTKQNQIKQEQHEQCEANQFNNGR